MTNTWASNKTLDIDIFTHQNPPTLPQNLFQTTTTTRTPTYLPPLPKQHLQRRLLPRATEPAAALMPVLHPRLQPPVEEKQQLGDDDAQLRVGEVLADAVARAVAKGPERRLVVAGEARRVVQRVRRRQPALGVEALRIVPVLWVAVCRVLQYGASDLFVLEGRGELVTWCFRQDALLGMGNVVLLRA